MLSGCNLPQSTVPSLLTGASSLQLSTLPPARSSVPTTGSTAGLDVPRLEGIVQGLFSAGLAASTQRTYRTGFNRYLKFARAATLTPFPVSKRSLCVFVGYLFEAKLASQTVTWYLSAVRFSQIALGLGNPKVDSMPRLEYVTRGLQKSAIQKKVPPLPITPPILRRLKLVWERMSSQHDALMLLAAACICFFGFLRSGEIVVPSETGSDQSSHRPSG